MKLMYKAVTQEGKTITGIIDAKDTSQAAEYLHSHQMFPIKIEQYLARPLEKFIFWKQKVNNKELVFLTRQLSSMLTSGLSLMQTLTILKNQTQNKAMVEVLDGIVTTIEGGGSLSAGLVKYPSVFSPIYISLIRAAETSGLLQNVLTRLADTLEKQQNLRSTVRGALVYPVLVLGMMVAVMLVMMLFVIPKITTLYGNAPLPLPTQIIVGISTVLLQLWPFMIGGAVAVVYGARRWYKTSMGRSIVDRMVLKMPIFGKLIQQSIMTEFCRTLGLLVGTGTLVVESLKESADVVGNVHYHKAILDISKRVEKGISIGDAMSTLPLFPAMVVEMVKIGEQTGQLDDSLVRISEYYERESEQTVRTLTTALEPFIMIMLAIGVAFLIFSIITPIYNLITSIQ